MKRIASLTIVFLVLITSCQEFPEQEVKLNSIEDMNILTKEILNYSASNLSSYLEKGKNEELWFDQNKMAHENFENLDGNFLDLSNIDLNQLASPFKKVDLTKVNLNSRVSNVDYGTFNEAQVVFADDFIFKLLAINDLSEVGRIVRNFHISVTNSSLSQEEKDGLHLLGSSALSIANFFIDGGADLIYQEMVIVFGEPTNPSFGGRVLGCSVDSRSVFFGAVGGLTIGAVKGAFKGAVGGTAVPGVGTVSGAVAVIGGAIGFVEGAILGGITSLLYTCFR
jgi:hypothetical protein